MTEFLSETFIYECKGWDIWGLPPLEYPGLAKVPLSYLSITPALQYQYIMIPMLMIDKVSSLCGFDSW